jgi:hypothetical protein
MESTKNNKHLIKISLKNPSQYKLNALSIRLLKV